MNRPDSRLCSDLLTERCQQVESISFFPACPSMTVLPSDPGFLCLATAGMSGRLEPLDIVLPVALHDWLRLSLSASRSCLPFELRLHASETLN